MALVRGKIGGGKVGSRRGVVIQVDKCVQSLVGLTVSYGTVYSLEAKALTLLLFRSV